MISNEAINMKLKDLRELPLFDEMSVMLRMLSFDEAVVLELGCGSAALTERVANHCKVKKIVASEVDLVAHKKNLIKKIDKINFASYGAEDIQEENESFDIVLMIKSLHHVPQNLMHAAMEEVYRVLKPGGVAYISEPVFLGELNEVIRLFHDEEIPRQYAFQAIKNVVESKRFQLLEEFFFYSQVKMRSFLEFRSLIMDATHANHIYSDSLLEKVRLKFESYRKYDDKDFPFIFRAPNRVDLIQKINRYL